MRGRERGRESERTERGRVERRDHSVLLRGLKILAPHGESAKGSPHRGARQPNEKKERESVAREIELPFKRIPVRKTSRRSPIPKLSALPVNDGKASHAPEGSNCLLLCPGKRGGRENRKRKRDDDAARLSLAVRTETIHRLRNDRASPVFTPGSNAQRPPRRGVPGGS